MLILISTILHIKYDMEGHDCPDNITKEYKMENKLWLAVSLKIV